jgi:hypothetical protein
VNSKKGRKGSKRTSDVLPEIIAAVRTQLKLEDAGSRPRPGGDWLLERLDEIERRYDKLPKPRRTPASTLRFAVEMLELVLFDLYIRRDSTPRPLLLLGFALKDKLNRVPSLLLDGEPRYGDRHPYSKEAYRRVQGCAAGIVEAWVERSKQLASTDFGQRLGLKVVKPIEAARRTAQTLIDEGFVARGRGSKLTEAKEPVERLARTITKWRLLALRGDADFQVHYDPDFRRGYLFFDENAALKHLASLCQLYRVSDP